MNSCKYSIVIPTLNERENIVHLIQKIEKLLISNFEIIVVDENSPDGTAEVVNEYAKGRGDIKAVLNDGIPGLSPSIVKGFSTAVGDYLCCMDGDMQHDVGDLSKIFEGLANNDFVIGSRYVDNGGFAERWSLSRTLISRTAALLTKIFLRINVNDPMSGYFAVRRSVFNKIKNRLSPRGFKIMLEMLYILSNDSKDKWRITEIGITFQKRKYGKSKLSMKVIIEFLKMLYKLPMQIKSN
jgi:dolichol-phosphate mannosyltransferase